jgi:hypothetical protein
MPPSDEYDVLDLINHDNHYILQEELKVEEEK